MGKTEYLLITIVFNLFFLLFMVAIIMYMWQYRRKKKENDLQFLYEKNVHQKELITTQLEMQKKTMQEIGREIHDNVGQKLTLASLHIQQLIYENKIPNDDESISNINSIINDSLADLRQLSKSLSDDSIDENTLPNLLKIETKKIGKIKECQLIIEKEDDYNFISYQEKSVLLRITQEFIQNAIKHADCTKITVSLTSKNNDFILSLSDNGKGFDSKNLKSEGIGLKNMKKRTDIVGGIFTMDSDTSGTRATIKIPLP